MSNSFNENENIDEEGQVEQQDDESVIEDSGKIERKRKMSELGNELKKARSK